MSEREVDILQNALLRSKQHLRDKTITSNLLRIITEPNQGIQHALRSLNELFHTDAAYLCFFSGGSIVSMDYQAGNKTVGFLPPPDMQIPRVVSREAQFRNGLSLLGNLPFINSCSYPLISGTRLVGLLELGSFDGKLAEPAFNKFRDLLSKVENAFLLVYDREVKVTQLHSMRKELQESQNRLEVIYSDSKDMIVTLDRSGKIMEMNAPGCALLGYPPTKPPQDFPLISPDISFIVSMIDRAAYISDLEIVIDTTSGNPIFGLASFSTAFDHHQPVIYGIVKNITDRVKMQQELQAVNMELVEANQLMVQSQSQLVQQEKMASIGELAAGVAHEINNPLAFVSSNFEMLGKYYHKLVEYTAAVEQLLPPGSPQLAELKAKFKIEKIEADANDILTESTEGFERIIKIIKSLKDFSRIDAAGTVSSINLNDALQSTINVARNSWKFVAEVETDFQLQENVECCASEINQVFLNIIVNAAQAIAEQKRPKPGKIVVSTTRIGEKACIKITDDGPGMPEKVRVRVFDPFFTTKPIGTGTGLGLSISYDIIVKKHSGNLMVESVPGKGSSFIIQLPLQASTGAQEVDYASLA